MVGAAPRRTQPIDQFAWGLLGDSRTLVAQAMQKTAGELSTPYSTFASRGDTWETMDLSQNTLRAIRDLEDHTVEVHTFLETTLLPLLPPPPLLLLLLFVQIEFAAGFIWACFKQ